MDLVLHAIVGFIVGCFSFFSYVALRAVGRRHKVGVRDREVLSDIHKRLLGLESSGVGDRLKELDRKTSTLDYHCSKRLAAVESKLERDGTRELLIWLLEEQGVIKKVETDLQEAKDRRDEFHALYAPQVEEFFIPKSPSSHLPPDVWGDAEIPEGYLGFSSSASYERMVELEGEVSRLQHILDLVSCPKEDCDELSTLAEDIVGHNQK